MLDAIGINIRGVRRVLDQTHIPIHRGAVRQIEAHFEHEIGIEFIDILLGNRATVGQSDEGRIEFIHRIGVGIRGQSIGGNSAVASVIDDVRTAESRVLVTINRSLKILKSQVSRNDLSSRKGFLIIKPSESGRAKS